MYCFRVENDTIKKIKQPNHHPEACIPFKTGWGLVFFFKNKQKNNN